MGVVVNVTGGCEASDVDFFGLIGSTTTGFDTAITQQYINARRGGYYQIMKSA